MGFFVIFWTLFPKIFSIPLVLIVVGFSLALAFYKINDKPFINVVQSAFYYLASKRLYIWKKEVKVPEKREMGKKQAEMYIPKLSSSKLKEISWSLDVQDLSKGDDSLENR